LPENTVLEKGIAILGSTGSIGTQTLDVIENSDSKFRVVLLSGHSNWHLLFSQIKKFRPKYAVITQKAAFDEAKNNFKEKHTSLLFGTEKLLQLLKLNEIDTVLHALVGFAGLEPLVHSILHKKQILLANKESLVVAGEYIMALAKENKVEIIPIDSEHSAIFQCLKNEKRDTVEKIILTASGGPFLHYSEQELQHIKPKDAIKHPIWDMGKKVCVDSAGLMNKGLEVIEARWLFNIPTEKIDVLIHPQSVVHSLIQFNDGRLRAQMGPPHMQYPIRYALHYPFQEENCTDFAFINFPELTFKQVDRKKFRNLALAFYAIEKGGNLPAILNAANEVAVQAFLEHKWPFYRIPELVEEMMAVQPYILNANLEIYLETTKKCFADSWAYIRKHNKNNGYSH